MIIPKLWARLGNQCYMLSCAIAHAKRMKTDWKSPAKTLDPRVWPIYFPNLPTARGYVPMHYYKELRHCYDPIPAHKDLLIDGYFQSEKYFEDAKPEVAKALGFNYTDGDYVAIHIRRGDYLEYPDHFPILAMDYYQQAIDYCVEKGWHQFKIYTDDQTWVRVNFKPEWHKAHVSYNGWPNNPVMDILDMYNAAGFIIANSTFSLFPATLRPDNPLVIAPAEQRWYGLKNNLDTSTLMPERFIKI